MKKQRKTVSFSGGADSTAVAILLHERGEDFELLFSDTGAELPETFWTVTEVARKLGRKLHVVSGGSFFQHLAGFGYLLPSIQRRWCTRLLKRAPLDRYVDALGANVEVAIGIRADEPKRIRDDGKLYPLVDAGLNKGDVLALCKKHDLLNPIYSWRSSCSCFCCPFQRRGDWRGLFEKHPDLFELACHWEDVSFETTLSGFTWMQGRHLRDLSGCDRDQLKLFPECTAEPCVICSH